MREILFRGKAKYNGEWIISGNVFFGEKRKYMYFPNPNNDPVEKAFVCREVIPETVGQYTGLTDKNGKKIFEGDIIQGENLILPVEYCGSSFCYIQNDTVYPIDDGEVGIYELLQSDYELIGNIYDNPELLKEGAENG